MYKLLIILSVLILNSCQVKKNKKKDYHWEYIYLELDNNYSYLFDKYNNEYEFVNLIDSTKIFKNNINSVEKDSLFKWTKSIIENPPYTEKFCTDYKGKLKITIIRDERIKQSIQINSVCNWSELSTETKNIKSLLNKLCK